ncbi:MULTISPECIES: F0F1 ATP synthase subunit epsilon [Moraxella]|uniref:ATP synthase epsilon chain n=1 Tax=Faucicola osloensis TaxID=34062 RepID=A0A173MSW0_FAUOS|nr:MULTISPECIES: F0F1 ATP synthase subunit epsilon [Moraxella]VWX30472.1 membrane-bound ATP synthase, F1 sector, epsilon-subunit [Moraxellaceae bacterium 17A]HBI48220.1 F0F1 ATP synthase subunit epsilon [Moraxellaceae bacterium]MBW4016422.1 F0F1 ATP synthase subunit epsilon [Moraxella osloensis]MBW4019235.1 F0F1 ATP synthase subunit epsilon [Moraxella osloensis]MCK6053351.1 F0F1 ATP synthase subunit epsilon [Moraxella osloensis]
MATLQCNVVSAKETIYSGEISMLIATGVEGEVGILPGHIPFITLLKPGTMQIKTSNGNDEMVYVSGGVLEVQPHLVTVLADTAVRANDLDEAKILEARRHAEQTLQNQKADIDTSAALAALAESLAQLQTLQKFKNRA